MEIQIEKIEPEFVPIKITLTINSQLEANALYQLGSYNMTIAKKLSDIVTNGKYKIDSDVAGNLFAKFCNDELLKP